MHFRVGSIRGQTLDLLGLQSTSLLEAGVEHLRDSDVLLAFS